MSIDAEQGTVSADPTLDVAARGFAALLSDDLEDLKPSETPPKQPAEKPAPTASESEDEAEAPEAAAFEDEPAESDETAEEQSEEPVQAALDPNLKVKVVIDGKEEEVTLAEALKGYSREAVFTRKSQALAEQRKTQEAEFNAVRGERAKYATLMSQLEQALQDNAGPEPDWAKVQTEQPDQFPALWAQWQQRKEEIAVVAAERQKAQAATQRDSYEAHQRYLHEEQTKLLDAIPEWKDAEKAKAGKAELVAYAEQVGFSKEDLSQVADHRAVLLLRKAMLFDKAQAAKPAIVQRIEKVKAVIPGAAASQKKPADAGVKARMRLAKTGSIEDAAAAFGNMLDDNL